MGHILKASLWGQRGGEGSSFRAVAAVLGLDASLILTATFPCCQVSLYLDDMPVLSSQDSFPISLSSYSTPGLNGKKDTEVFWVTQAEKQALGFVREEEQRSGTWLETGGGPGPK